MIGLRHLQGLVAERGRCAWEVGDLLVEVYGPPPAPGVMDGSRARLDQLANVLDCSTSWLVSCRITSHAWPRRERRGTVSWPVHRALSARDDRVVLLAGFVTSCDRSHITPSLARLTDWLDQSPRARGLVDDQSPHAWGLLDEITLRVEGDSPDDTSLHVQGVSLDETSSRAWGGSSPSCAVTARSPSLRRVGRPRSDPVDRVERLALTLDRDALVRLVQRLTAALATATIARAS